MELGLSGLSDTMALSSEARWDITRARGHRSHTRAVQPSIPNLAKCPSLVCSQSQAVEKAGKLAGRLVPMRAKRDWQAATSDAEFFT